MSYDLIFVSRSDDQSRDDALEEAAEEADSDDRPSAEAWARLVAAARRVLGEVAVRVFDEVAASFAARGISSPSNG
ncbi:hypothetical protein [Micromonospora chokoriensis]|nr:hypothetical protein [Micromonospora chokoriensis]